jgi:hypothetical protein
MFLMMCINKPHASNDQPISPAVNCIDQHIKTKADQVAIIWEKDEPGQTEFITYHQLLSEVTIGCRTPGAASRVPS